MKSERLHLPTWGAAIYYAAAIVLRPGTTSQFPFQTDDLVLFGVVPAIAGVIGILTSGWHDGRTLAWCIFLLGVIGVAFSFIPWHLALREIAL